MWLRCILILIPCLAYLNWTLKSNQSRLFVFVYVYSNKQLKSNNGSLTVLFQIVICLKGLNCLRHNSIEKVKL